MSFSLQPELGIDFRLVESNRPMRLAGKDEAEEPVPPPALLLNLAPSPSYSMRTASTGTLPVARPPRVGGKDERERERRRHQSTIASSALSQGSRGGAKAMTFSMQAPSGMSDSSSSSDEEEVESRPPTAALSSAVVPLPSTTATTTKTSETPPALPPPPPPRHRPLRGLRQLPPALAALADLALFRRRRCREEASAEIARLDAALMSVDADEADAVAAAAASAARLRAQEAAEAAARAEKEAAAADVAVSRRLHAASAAAGARADAAAAKARAAATAEAAERAEAEARRRKDEEEQAAAAAAARRRRQEAEEKAARERQEKEEVDRRKREQQAKAAAAEEAKKTAAAAAAAAAADAKAKADAAAGAKAASLPRPAVVASPHATFWAERAAAALAAARASAAPFLADASPAAKTRRRAVDRAITLAVQQISATTSQVDAKSRQLSELLNSLSAQTGEKSYGSLAFAARVVAQCECQVALSPAFAFPLAQVVAAVCSSAPGPEGSGELFDIVSGRLHAASPLTVPSWVRAGAEGHHKRIGYREKSTGRTAGDELESTDDFAARLRGYALFLGALVAAADAGRWQGQRAATSAAAARARGWSFVASALNALPPNRLTAVVLDGFLDAGGHALYRAYGRQFLKLLAALDEFFLPALEARRKEGGGGPATNNSGDADAARPAAARLRSYLHGGAFREPPEGSVLPESDASSYDRA